MAESSILKSRKQQSVQTDDSLEEMDSFRPLSRRHLPTNFSHTILLSPPIPPPPTSRKSAQSSHHPKNDIKDSFEVYDALELGTDGDMKSMRLRLKNCAAIQSTETNAKLVLVYETKDSSGKLIDQPSLTVDEAEKQVRLIRPTADSSPSVGGISSAPKNFPSDGAFSDQESMKDFCSAVLSDQISVVASGSDGCVIYLNPVGKRAVSRFVGSDADTAHFGLIPTAIQWLFTALDGQHPTSSYLTVSITEVCTSGTKSNDLLSELKNAFDPHGRKVEELKSGIFAWRRPFLPHAEDDTTELVATTVADAAHYLDMALSASKRLHESTITATSPGHLFFTLNVYRNHPGGTVIVPNKMEHCQLNLIELMLSSEIEGDFGEDPTSKNTSTVNFILNLISGRASPPFGTKEPILHHLLRGCLLADDLAKLSIVLHTSVHPNFYTTNLEFLQQISKIQHVWKHRSSLKLLRSSSQRRQNSICDRITTSTTSPSSNLSSIRLRRLGRRMQRRRLGRNGGAFVQAFEDVLDSASDLEYTSSSEQSCTTVIYLGRSHPLRKLNASDRPKRLTTIEKKETTQKTEEKSDPLQVRSPVLSHHRRFKGRSGHKVHAETMAHELWVDGPKATADITMSPHFVEKSAHFGTPSRRRRSESISDRDQSSGGRIQNTVEKGVPDGKAFNSHENLERKLESRMRKLNWSNDPSGNSKIIKQLEALLTPRSDRKIRRGDSIFDSRQQTQIDQVQQTPAEVLVVTNWKYDSFPVGGSSAIRGVKPFVREWVERQNQAIVGYFADQPTSPKHGCKQVCASGKPDTHCHTTTKTVETPQISRTHRSHEGKKQVDPDDFMIAPNDSVSHSHSLPRHVTTEVLWTTQNHQVSPAVDNLSRVARWVESVSTSEHSPPALSKGCSKHPLQSSPLCKSCSKGVTCSSASKSPEVTGRGSSAPAARFRAQHGAMMFQAIDENQSQSTAKPPSDSRKPDGASDPGLHRDQSFGSVSGLDTITEGLKASPLRKPVLKRFADLFVCSPSSNRRRQQQSLQQQASKICTPFFGGVGSSGGSEREVIAEGDLLSINSAGMLFTSLSKGRGGEESLFLEAEQTGRTASSMNQQGAEKYCDEGQQGRLRLKEAGTKHRLGFLQSPLFGKCSPNRTVPTEALASAAPQTAPAPSLQRFHPSRQQQQQDSMAFHCQVVFEKSPHTHCHHKCVSQSSSSGLGSEHSEQQSLRCHCLVAQSGARIRRCRMRTHRTRIGVTASPEGENEGGALATTKFTCASGGGHASSGYESVLRDDSELSSQSSSGGSYPWPPVGAKEAACQTMPCDLTESSIAVPQTSSIAPEVLTTSLTDTVSVSATGDTMLASITSKTSGERTLSTSTSKRSLSAPAGSSEESRSSSLPSVRRVSPQRSQVPLSGCNPLDYTTPQNDLNRSELGRANSEAIEATRTTFRQRRIAALLQRQEQLKAELTDAKLRLLADPGSWSFDLNVAEHMNPNDEGYLEALTDETELLQQRVDACRSHAQYLAFFHPPTVPLSPAPPPPPPPPPPPSTGFHESPK